ncbi:MAG: type II secretion system protein [Clostridia bacterium]
MKKTGKNKGFTLVELIVVIAILVILAAILIPVVSGYIDDANNAAGLANARTVYAAAAAASAASRMPGKTPLTGELTNATTEMKDYLGGGFTGTYTATLGADGGVTKATWNSGATGATTYNYPATTVAP